MTSAGGRPALVCHDVLGDGKLVEDVNLDRYLLIARARTATQTTLRKSRSDVKVVP